MAQHAVEPMRAECPQIGCPLGRYFTGSLADVLFMIAPRSVAWVGGEIWWGFARTAA